MRGARGKKKKKNGHKKWAARIAIWGAITPLCRGDSGQNPKDIDCLYIYINGFIYIYDNLTTMIICAKFVSFFGIFGLFIIVSDKFTFLRGVYGKN